MQQCLEFIEAGEEESWDFASANTKEFTHCYHGYPAMMIPQIARRLIRSYGEGVNLLFDPYCGSGTSLVEARLAGINSAGTDLNPLARLISRAKTSVYNIEKLKKVASKLCMNIKSGASFSVKVPDFKNIDYWFSQKAQYDLAILKSIIEEVCPKDLVEFFLIPFSEAVRESSYTRKSEFKLYRIAPDKIASHHVNTFELYLTKLNRNMSGYNEFYQFVKGERYSRIFDFNTCEGIPEELKGPVDLVVTSPPYGDSRTTVAYGQFSRLSNQWLGVEDASQVDNILMGGKPNNNRLDIEINSAKMELLRIREFDLKRYTEVHAFLVDYWKSIRHVANVVKQGGYICYVVGNRTVKNVKIPLDKITAEFFSQFGCDHIGTFERNIPSKRMPHKNSPSNIIGQLSSTMTGEHIVVMRKIYQ